MGKTCSHWPIRLALHTILDWRDEAHNAKTEKAFVIFTRLNPSAVFDLTATPIAGSNGVPPSVRRSCAEHMIKMPIMLTEHTEGWEAGAGCLHTRGGPRTPPSGSTRPGGAYPAHCAVSGNQRNRVAPPDKLRDHLINEPNVLPEQIAAGNRQNARTRRHRHRVAGLSGLYDYGAGFCARGGPSVCVRTVLATESVERHGD